LLLLESNIQLDPQQIEVLKKYNSDVDPLIELKPSLDNLFIINDQNKLYKYPNDFNIKSFTSRLQISSDNHLFKIFNGKK
jgi:hypothetical protein